MLIRCTFETIIKKPTQSMKKLLFTVAALLPLAVFAQKPFSIAGNIKGLKTGDKIYLVYKDSGKDVTDSVEVKDGTFAFKGVFEDPARANLFLNKNPFTVPPAPGEILDYAALYIEPAAIKITAADSLKKAVITGSPVNEEDKKLKALIKPVTDQLIAIDGEFGKLTPEQQKDEAMVAPLRERYGKALAGLTPVYLDYAKNNPKSFVSLSAIAQLAGNPEQLLAAEKVYNTLSPALKATKTGKSIGALFTASKGTAIGSLAMDFSQNDVNDKPVKLSDFRGKYVLLDFWASWCGPCRDENPNVVKAFQTYKDKNFTVLGVSLDQPGKKEAWLQAIEKDGLTWTHVSDLKGWQNEAAVKYGIRGIPANFLIDPSGKIIAKNVRGEDLQKKLAEVLNGGTR